MNVDLVQYQAVHIIDYDCLLVKSVINLSTSISKLKNVATNLLLVHSQKKKKTYFSLTM